MRTITIDNKPVEIPTFKELTINQYSEIVKFISKGDSIDPLRYISITTGADYAKALHFEVKNISRLNDLMGEFLFIAGDIDEAGKKGFIETAKPKLILKHALMIHDLRKKKVNAVGYRILLEQFLKTKPNYIELYSFMYAVILNTEISSDEFAFDYESAMEVYETLGDRNAFQILTLGSFFFYRWSKKENSVSLLSRMLKRVLLKSMRLRERKLVLVDSRNITRSKK